jgi:hypothetical protein
MGLKRKARIRHMGVETHNAMVYAPATILGITLAKNDVLTVTDLNTVDARASDPGPLQMGLAGPLKLGRAIRKAM